MSTHVYFYTIFFLKPWFSEINGWWESGREWRDTGADPGVLQVCVCVCVCSEGTQASVYYLWRYLIGCRVSCFRSPPGPDIFGLKQAANTKAG